MFEDSTEVVESMKSSINMSLKSEVNETDVNDEKIERNDFQ
jgi:hypothetical protein